MADVAYLKCPHSDEVKAVEATAEKLSPLLASGWYQVPAPAEQKPAIPAEEEK
jgi:hypothetical protein